ncbi:MAG: TRAP transporter substrate-binding protein DctP [Thermodesulfobacteriota bacterium]
MRTGRVLLWLAAALLILGFTAQGALARDVVRWKMATLAPKGMGWANLIENQVLPWVKQQTDDNVRIKVYFGGVLGNDKEYLEKMAVGQINGAALDAMGSNLACPEMTVLGLPFLFNNYEEVDHIREVMLPTFDYYFQQNGYKLWMWMDQDFDQIYSTKWKFDKIEDFSKAKFHTWYGPMEQTMLEDLGATPVPVQPTEAAMAFRTGLIDSSIGPAIFQVGTQIYTSCRYINTMKTRYCPATAVLRLDDWNQLDPEYRKKLADTTEVVRQFTLGTRKDNDRCIEGMIKYGLELVEMKPENKAFIVKKASRVYDQLADKVYPKDLLLEVQRYLAAYRAGKPVASASAPVKRKPAEKEAVAAKKAEAAGKADAETAEMMAKLQKVYQEDMEAQKKKQAEEKAPGAIEKKEEMPKPEDAAAKHQAAWQERARQIRAVQEVLAPLGLYPVGMIDGIFGPMTRKGIQEYQKQKGLAVTGAISRELLDAMGIK